MRRMIQTNTGTFVVLLAFIFIFSSCEKVIDIDLDKVEKKYVVEGILTNQENSSYVLISQTNDFDQPNDFPAISGATVRITESGGASFNLTETQRGRYEATGLRGTSGKTYTLTVTVNGQTFTANSTMPPAVNLDTIYLTNDMLFDEFRKTINVEHSDPIGLGNSYRYVSYINGNKKKTIYIRNDDYSDGRYINSKLFDFEDDEDDEGIQTGDVLKVDFQCIDPVIYRYWFSLLRSSTGSSGQATPANPVSNIQGGALGYFSAHTLQSKTMVAN